MRTKYSRIQRSYFAGIGRSYFVAPGGNEIPALNTQTGGKFTKVNWNRVTVGNPVPPQGPRNVRMVGKMYRPMLGRYAVARAAALRAALGVAGPASLFGPDLFNVMRVMHDYWRPPHPDYHAFTGTEVWMPLNNIANPTPGAYTQAWYGAIGFWSLAATARGDQPAAGYPWFATYLGNYPSAPPIANPWPAHRVVQLAPAGMPQFQRVQVDLPPLFASARPAPKPTYEVGAGAGWRYKREIKMTPRVAIILGKYFDAAEMVELYEDILTVVQDDRLTNAEKVKDIGLLLTQHVVEDIVVGLIKPKSPWHAARIILR